MGIGSALILLHSRVQHLLPPGPLGAHCAPGAEQVGVGSSSSTLGVTWGAKRGRRRVSSRVVEDLAGRNCREGGNNAAARYDQAGEGGNNAEEMHAGGKAGQGTGGGDVNEEEEDIGMVLTVCRYVWMYGCTDWVKKGHYVFPLLGSRPVYIYYIPIR